MIKNEKVNANGTTTLTLICTGCQHEREIDVRTKDYVEYKGKISKRRVSEIFDELDEEELRLIESSLGCCCDGAYNAYDDEDKDDDYYEEEDDEIRRTKEESKSIEDEEY